jgi:hypothetical protein
MRPISSNDTGNVARLLGVDERLVQLPDPPDICRCRFAPDKHRELESVVPIPSARQRDGWVAEGDWPAVKCWSNGGMTMRWNVLFIAATLLVAASQPSVAQFRVDMNQITCGGWLGYSPEQRDFVRFWMSGYYNAAANSNVLNYDRFQGNSAKVTNYCRTHKSQTLPTAIKNLGLWQ